MHKICSTKIRWGGFWYTHKETVDLKALARSIGKRERGKDENGFGTRARSKRRSKRFVDAVIDEIFFFLSVGRRQSQTERVREDENSQRTGGGRGGLRRVVARRKRYTEEKTRETRSTIRIDAVDKQRQAVSSMTFSWYIPVWRGRGSDRTRGSTLIEVLAVVASLVTRERFRG